MTHQIKIRPNPLPPFRKLYELPKGTWMVINMGGRGSGKSYEGSKWTIIEVAVNGKRAAVLRDEKTTIADSIMHEIKNRYQTLNEKSGGYFDRIYQMHESEMKHRSTGRRVLFTKGFRASSNQKTANLKSISDLDISIIEEFEDITDEFAFNKFADGVRNDGAIIFINSNVPDMNHWFIRRHYDLKDTEHDGYFELVPRMIPGVVYIFSTWEDNPHLPPHIKEKYRAYGDPGSPFYDLHYYLTQIKGLCSSGRKGQIYKNWRRITNAEFNEQPYRSVFGLDFGSASPMALVELKFSKGRIWQRQLIYQTGMELLDLAIRLCELGFTTKEVIIADHARPDFINKLRNGWTRDELKEGIAEKYPQLLAGFDVVGCIKGPIKGGIDRYKSYEVFMTDDSSDWWSEYVQYCWAIDKNGNPTDDPLDNFNHAMDSGRYCVLAKGRIFE